MRRSTLLLVLTLVACGAGERQEQDTYAVVDGFLDRAVPAHCTPVRPADSVSVTEIRSVTDSTWLLLDEPQRRITEFDHEMRTLWSMAYATTGPGAALKAVSAALLGDTAVAIADRGTIRLQVLARDGTLIRSTPLEFLPNVIATTAAGEVLVTPLRVGDQPETLLLRFDGERWTELDVPPRYYPDVMHRTMGNFVRVEAFPDGRALVTHEYLAPRGLILERDGTARLFPVPTPDATLDQLAFMPALPLTEEDQRRILVPAIQTGIDRSRSEVYIMTRSGRIVDGVSERAILRLNDRLGFEEAFTAPVSAFGMAVLPRHGRVILADEDDGLFSCDLPGRSAHAQAH